MKNKNAFLVTFALLTAINSPALGMGARYTPAPVIIPVASPTVAPSLSPAPSPIVEPSAGKIISLKCDSTCTPAEAAEVKKIEKKMNETLSSQCFTDYFKKPGRKLEMNLGLTPDQILERLRKPASLTLSYFNKVWAGPIPGVKHTLTEGYEDASDFNVIHFNRYKVSNWSACEKASIGLHEKSHTNGFFHKGNLAAPNWLTVPYQVNHALEGNEDAGSFDTAGKCCKDDAA